MMDELGYKKVCETICDGHGTAQCAAICLQHFASSTRNGQCPHATEVWGKHAAAVQWHIRGAAKRKSR